jgi:hypothetical protein
MLLPLLSRAGQQGWGGVAADGWVCLLLFLPSPLPADANLVLGRILPDFFPHIFGPKEDEALDAEGARSAPQLIACLAMYLLNNTVCLNICLAVLACVQLQGGHGSCDSRGQCTC